MEILKRFNIQHCSLVQLNTICVTSPHYINKAAILYKLYVYVANGIIKDPQWRNK